MLDFDELRGTLNDADSKMKKNIEHEEGPKAREMLNIEDFCRSKGHPKVNAEKCIFL